MEYGQKESWRGFVAVRNNGTRDWIDWGTMAHSAGGCQQLVEKDAEQVPNWHKANPVQRIYLAEQTIEIMEGR